MPPIHCALIGHAHLHEAQTIAQVFYPNRRFVFSENNAVEPPPHLVSRLSDGEAVGEVYENGALRVSRAVRPGGLITEKRAVMLSLFHALKQVTDVYTPWGALTGIRPSKLARGWQDEGLTDEAIISALTGSFCCHENKARLAVAIAHAEKRLTAQIQGVGLYVSVPFCPSRCLYCSFNLRHKADPAAYIHALIRELKQKAATRTAPVTAVYIGGGTPTALPEDLLYALLETVATAFSPAAAEFTVEAGRPDSLTPGKLRILRGFGVNRIAVNPQTLNDATLARIGRSHTAADFFSAFALAREAGFACINADIIAGLPGESAADMARTLAGLLPLAPENLTIHTMAVKRSSRLNEYLSDYAPASADVYEIEKMLELARAACDRAGLAPYYLYRQKNMVGLFENIGYSRPGHECLYNIGMMAETQTVIGAGAAAVSKFVDGDRIERAFNVKNPEVYIGRGE